METFLASIAGINRLLLTFFTYFFGGFVKFRSKQRWIKSFYRFSYLPKPDEDDSDKEGKLKRGNPVYQKASQYVNLSIFNSFRYYLKHNTQFVSICCKLLKESEDERVYNKIMKKGLRQLGKDFNYKQVVNYLND